MPATPLFTRGFIRKLALVAALSVVAMGGLSGCYKKTDSPEKAFPDDKNLSTQEAEDAAMPEEPATSEEVKATMPTGAAALPVVYMTSHITPEGLMAVYEALGRKPAPGQKVGIKISTGEGDHSNHLRPEFIREFVQTLGGDIVETNTAYGGNRGDTDTHYRTIQKRGFPSIATTVILDETATIDIPVSNGRHLDVNRIGARFSDYQFHVVLSHFKGHMMAGFGGALKNMAIGYASSAGKSYIHTGGKRWTGFSGEQDAFLESMAEAAKSVVDFAGEENFIYINVMNRLSIDCDCVAKPKKPTMADIGILASLDPVALDKAGLDLVDKAPDGADLQRRIRDKNGTLTVTHAAAIGLGSLEYTLVNIDERLD